MRTLNLAVRLIFSRRPWCANVTFVDEYWRELTPEKAFLARVFVDHCMEKKDEVRREAALPVVTALAYRIQAAYNDLIDQFQNDEEESVLRILDEEERAQREDERIAREFIIGEMLLLAVNLDYSDEIGRRKMFQLVRGSLSSVLSRFCSSC